MGLENREYYREPPGGSGFLGWGTGTVAPVCKWLIIANIAVFLLQIFVTRPPRVEDFRTYGLDPDQVEQIQSLPGMDMLRVSLVEDWLKLDTRKVLYGQVWRVLTYAFCHDRMSIWHILFNMLFLWWFGKTLEAMYGSREFLLFYLCGALAAALCHIGLDLFTREFIPAIGASGAVMAVVMLYAIHYPRHTIYLFMIIPIEIRWIVLIYVIFDLHPVLLALAGTPTGGGVAHAAHLGGLAFGWAYWRYGLRLENYADRIRGARLDRVIGPRRRIKLYQPSDDPRQEDFDARVDEVLQKIHDQGDESLTDEERAVLKIAAVKYKNRLKGDPS